MPSKISKIKLNNHITKSILFVVVAVIIFCLSFFRVFDLYELVLLDLRFKIRPVQQFIDDIVIIEISDDTLQNLSQWPLPRDFHASLMDVLRELKVKQVFFDILFSEKTRWDDVFRASLKKADNAYLSYAFRLDSDPRPGAFRASSEIIAPLLDNFNKVVHGSGHINILTDADGKSRWAPLFVKYKDDLHPHIALKAACDYLGISLEDVALKNNYLLIGKELSVPVSDTGCVMINYVGPWTKSFKHYSYFDILAAYQEEREGVAPRINLRALRGKVCFVGLTATGTLDLHAMPLEPIYPMVGLHANIFNSIVLKKFLTRLSRTINLVILAVLILLALLITLKFRPLKSFLTVFCLGISYALICFALFVFLGLWLDLFFPLVILMVVYLSVTLLKFLSEARKNELMEKELSIAKEIQISFLPDEINKFADIEIASDMVTAKHVGGDLYDIRVLDDDKLGIFLGDVAGKGVSAALVMAKAISLFRIFSTETESPAALLEKLNDAMVKDSKSGLFVTSTYIIYDSKQHKVILSSGGHLPTLLVKGRSAESEMIDVEGGMPLGIMDGVEFCDKTIGLNIGDSVVLYTDGVVEAKNIKREDFEEERLVSCVAESKNLSVQDIISTIKSKLRLFVGKAPQHDDITIIVFKRV